MGRDSAAKIAELLLLTSYKVQKIRAGLILPLQVAAERRHRRGFERRLFHYWQPLINVLDDFIHYSRQLGMGINKRCRYDAVVENDLVFDVLVRIHARCCLVSSEARALIVSGHASEALARWRSLHELVVVASFIKEHGQEVATRYVLHADVSSFKMAKQYREHQAALKVDPLTDAEYELVRRRRDELVAAFGKSFEGEWGWAAGVLPGEPRFDQIEKAVGISHWRPYYRAASDSIHAGFKGSVFELGKFGASGAEDTILSGPSQFGLIDPIQSVIITMMHMNTILANHRVDIKGVSQMQVAMSIHDKAKKLVENWAD